MNSDNLNDLYTFGIEPAKKGHVFGADANLFGGKGAHLIEMAELGLPVPAGVVIPTTWCTNYKEDPEGTREDLLPILEVALKNAKLLHGAYGSPLCMLSVRSGAPVSMPGMMDTILNLGSADTGMFHFLRKAHGDTVAKALRDRYLDSYGKLVLGKKTPPKLSELPGQLEQIWLCVEAVLNSWNTERAVHYRKMHGIPDDLGTAVVIQKMVLGTANLESGTGVMFTRNPSTGEGDMVGEWLPMAQGEEIVDGSTIPESLDSMIADTDFWNSIHDSLCETAAFLEDHYKEAQDVEFTVEKGKLWILQTRNLKPSARAKIRIASEMATEGLIDRDEAASRITYADWLASRSAVLMPTADDVVSAHGLAASVGVGIGRIVTSVEAVLATEEPTILYRPETTPDDIKGMEKAVAIITTLGGSTCHAAVVARAMNKPCIVGIGLSPALHALASNASVATVDGHSGNIYAGEVAVTKGGADIHASRIVAWASKDSKTPVYGPDPRFHEIVAISEWGDRVNEFALALLEDDKAAKVLVLNDSTDSDDVDTGVWEMFGDGDGPGEELAPVVAAFLLEFRTMIDDLAILTADVETRNVMKFNGYNIPKSVASVADLLSPGLVTLSDAFVHQAIGGPEALAHMSPIIGATIINNAISEAEAAERFLKGDG